MANSIILKKSSVSGKVPLAGDLVFGELAINYADGKLYYKSSDGNTVVYFQAANVSGGGLDQVTTITKALTLGTDWQDTGISGSDIVTGTYIVQLFANDSASGGTNSNEYYSGTLSWYSGTTTSSLEMPTDEIVLHRAGAGGEGALYLRTFRASTGGLKLQIYSNTPNASAANYVFKFRRMI